MTAALNISAGGLHNDLAALRPGVRVFLDRVHGHAIGGTTAPGTGERLAIVDPTSGTPVASVARGTEADIDAAVRAARAAFRGGDWPALKPHARERLMHRLADLIEARAEDIAELEAVESGRLRFVTRLFDVEFSAHVLRYMAGWPTKIHGRTLTPSVPYYPDRRFAAHTVREPLGVVGAITPWNVPLCLAVWKVAPALAAGCTVVLKPAEETPLTALLLAELALEAGIPPGVVNVVTGTGAEAGAALVRHPGIDRISFTGSTEVGLLIAQEAARTLRKVTLELGGKSPVVIMDDADLDAAIPGAAWAIFGNHGQNCCAGSRLYVHEKVYDRVLAGVADIARAIRLGPGLAPDTEMGPLVSQRQRARVQAYVESGVAEGAELVTGGRSVAGQGCYFEPTVLAGVRQQMRVVQEEIFGPVLVASRFADIEEALRLANDTRYGLGGSIWTRDLDAAAWFGRHLEAGSVWVNVHNVLDAALPFGGYRYSGMGHDLGEESVLANTRIKSTVVALGR